VNLILPIHRWQSAAHAARPISADIPRGALKGSFPIKTFGRAVDWGAFLTLPRWLVGRETEKIP
jgi:hypothetical protein